MKVDVPVEFQSEVERASADDLEDLRLTIGSTAVLSGYEPDKLEASLVRAGWSAEFAEWYVALASRYGTDLDLVQRDFKAELREYDAWRTTKDGLIRRGWTQVVIGISAQAVIRFSLMAGQDANADGGLLILALLLAVLVYFWGLVLVCDAKGYSRNVAWVGFLGPIGCWSLWMREDLNKREPPQRGAPAKKSEGSAFSDW